MADAQVIVDALARKPFARRGLTMVALDEMDSYGLQDLLRTVLAEIDNVPHPQDKDCAVDARSCAEKLSLLRYPMPSDVGAFLNGFTSGARDVMYPVLAFLLQRIGPLKKRAYVSRFLVPAHVPAELMADELVAELARELVNLQSDFKDTHQQLERVNASIAEAASHDEGVERDASDAQGEPQPAMTVAHLKREVGQLEEEHAQLGDKIAAMKRKAGDAGAGFKPLLAATTMLRKEQEEEGRLADRLADQRAALSAADARYAECARKLAEAKASSRESLTPVGLLDAAKRDADDARALAKQTLPASLRSRKLALARLQEALGQPRYTEDELLQLQREVRAAQEGVQNLTSELTAAQRAAGNEKLATLQQQAAAMARRVAEAEVRAESARIELESLDRELEEKRGRLSGLAGSGPAGGIMSADEFQRFAGDLRAKTAQFKTAKDELAVAKGTTRGLTDQVASLTDQLAGLEGASRKAEEERGIAGFADTLVSWAGPRLRYHPRFSTARNRGAWMVPQ